MQDSVEMVSTVDSWLPSNEAKFESRHVALPKAMNTSAPATGAGRDTAGGARARRERFAKQRPRFPLSLRETGPCYLAVTVGFEPFVYGIGAELPAGGILTAVFPRAELKHIRVQFTARK
jgi:hypothetical protein